MILSILLISIVHGSYLTPEQIHISWTENQHEMRVTWKVYPMNANSQLSYKSLCNRTDSDNWEFIKPHDYVYKHGSLPSQYLIVCTAVIKNLQKGCDYEYRISNAGIWSDTYRFRSKTPFYEYPFTTADLNAETNIVIIGDMGTGPTSLPTRNLLREYAKKGLYDGLFHLGDIGYNLNDEDGYIGSLYSNEIQDIAANAPYMTIPGNHEKANNFTDYSNRFIMPTNWASQDSSFYYSLNIGRAHFIALNTEVFFYDKKPQIKLMLKWLEEDLQLANLHRKEVPWIIAMGHKPLYCGIDTRYESFEKYFSNNNVCILEPIITQKYLEDLFYKYKVDLAIGAHVHNYERQAAIYKNQTVESESDTANSHHNAKAPIYIVEGISGNYMYREPITKTPRDWLKFSSMDFGFGIVKVINTTHLYWEQVSSEKDEVLDTLMITKD